jgi:hypothetical protein
MELPTVVLEIIWSYTFIPAHIKDIPYYASMFYRRHYQVIFDRGYTMYHPAWY